MKAKCKKSRDERVLEGGGPLNPTELKHAEMYWVKEAQKTIHDRLKRGEFKTLSPYIEEDIIRVGGRAEESLMSYDSRHPVLLPQKHHISMLITRYFHERGHSGVAGTAAKVRRA